MGAPPSLITRPLPSLSSAALISSSPCAFFTSEPGTVSGRVVVPMVLSSEKRSGVCLATWSTFSASVKNLARRACTAALFAPPWSFQAT